MPSWIGLKFANLGQNNQILCENREKLENICSIYKWWVNGVKLCKGEIHHLTKYISYDVGLNMSQISLWVKIVKFHAKNRKKNWKQCRIRICLCISVKFCTVLVHKFSKDIIYDIKLNMSKLANMGQNNHSVNKCKKFENICSILFCALV